MTPENQISSEYTIYTPPTFLENTLQPQLVGRAWIYQSRGREMLILNDEGRLTATPDGARELSPKKSFFNRIILGWTLRLEMREGKNTVLATSKIGENSADLFKNIFVIDQKRGQVVTLSLPGQKVLSLLELENDNNPVFIPVSPKGKEGGVLVVSSGVLKKPQNQGRIKGFLKA